MFRDVDGDVGVFTDDTDGAVVSKYPAFDDVTKASFTSVAVSSLS